LGPTARRTRRRGKKGFLGRGTVLVPPARDHHGPGRWRGASRCWSGRGRSGSFPSTSLSISLSRYISRLPVAFPGGAPLRPLFSFRAQAEGAPEDAIRRRCLICPSPPLPFDSSSYMSALSKKSISPLNSLGCMRHGCASGSSGWASIMISYWTTMVFCDKCGSTCRMI
jgi:hypothetical protein